MNTQPLASQPKANAASPRLVDDHGDLTTAGTRSQLQFGFVVGKVSYRAQLHTHGDRMSLLITGDIAALPYSAESPSARSAIIALLGSMKRHSWGSCGLSEKYRITVAGEIPIASPVNPISLLSTAVHFVLRSQPISRQVQQELLAHGAFA
ncbi:MAG: hypothetical protein ACTSX7_04745 [Alphaproteobacteria bacterium]